MLVGAEQCHAADTGDKRGSWQGHVEAIPRSLGVHLGSWSETSNRYFFHWKPVRCPLMGCIISQTVVHTHQGTLLSSSYRDGVAGLQPRRSGQVAGCLPQVWDPQRSRDRSLTLALGPDCVSGPCAHVASRWRPRTGQHQQASLGWHLSPFADIPPTPGGTGVRVHDSFCIISYNCM